jgi:hypothetical protein
VCFRKFDIVLAVPFFYCRLSVPLRMSAAERNALAVPLLTAIAAEASSYAVAADSCVLTNLLTLTENIQERDGQSPSESGKTPPF